MFHWEVKKRWAAKTSDRIRHPPRCDSVVIASSTYTSQIETWQAMQSKLGGIDGEEAMRFTHPLILPSAFAA
jgi:hypothetical protein